MRFTTLTLVILAVVGFLSLGSPPLMACDYAVQQQFVQVRAAPMFVQAAPMFYAAPMRQVVFQRQFVEQPAFVAASPAIQNVNIQESRRGLFGLGRRSRSVQVQQIGGGGFGGGAVQNFSLGGRR